MIFERREGRIGFDLTPTAATMTGERKLAAR
jgi:hypothetical protein